MVTTPNHTETLDEKLMRASSLAYELENNILRGKIEAIDYKSGKKINLDKEILEPLRRSNDKYRVEKLLFSGYHSLNDIGNFGVGPDILTVGKSGAPLYVKSTVVLYKGRDPESGREESAAIYIPNQRIVEVYWGDEAERHIKEGMLVVSILPSYDIFERLENKKIVGIVFTDGIFSRDMWVYKLADK